MAALGIYSRYSRRFHSPPSPTPTCHIIATQQDETNTAMLVCQLVFIPSYHPIILLTVKADNPELLAALGKYHREGITNNVKISERLRKEYNILLM